MFPRLILNSVKNDKIDMILKIPKKEFIISYIHSVNKSKIRDYYNINKDKDIVLEKTRFVSYGAGVPEPKGQFPDCGSDWCGHRHPAWHWRRDL